MEYRYLGKSGLQVSALSLGAWVTYGGQVGEDVAYDCMKAAVDLIFCHRPDPEPDYR
jgi:aryl-alcohol dehydrogenase-like predicted oxidoreductase